LWVWLLPPLLLWRIWILQLLLKSFPREPALAV
jgi:hypothetical protein